MALCIAHIGIVGHIPHCLVDEVARRLAEAALFSGAASLLRPPPFPPGPFHFRIFKSLSRIIRVSIRLQAPSTASKSIYLLITTAHLGAIHPSAMCADKAEIFISIVRR